MIAVTGASGQLGRLTVRLLREQVGAAEVIALSRTPETIGDLGVATRVANFDDPGTLVPAFAGIQRLMLVSTNAFGATGRRVRQHTNAVRAAAAAGVEHVVYTSIANAGDPAHPGADAADHRATEAVLAESGLGHTVLRNSMYTELLLMGVDVALNTGMLVDNSGYGATSYVTRQDCAAVAATLLARGGYGERGPGQQLEITGPRAFTMVEIAALITEFSGVPVRYLPVSDDATVADLVACGMAERAARLFATTGQSIREGYTNVVTDVVERVTGRRPVSVAEVLAANLMAPVSNRDGRPGSSPLGSARPSRTRPISSVPRSRPPTRRGDGLRRTR